MSLFTDFFIISGARYPGVPSNSVVWCKREGIRRKMKDTKGGREGEEEGKARRGEESEGE